jgi:predicted  nucleic acid-binding Zn-ribbon protein
MGELIHIVDSLENKLSKLLHKMEMLQEANQELENEVNLLKNNQKLVHRTITDWEEKYNALKLANTMLGSNEDKTEAKLKINTLIRELDHCIAQLAE